MQIWAVDVSAYSLWTPDGRKGESVIQTCLEGSQDEHIKVKKYLREIDQIRCLAGKVLVRLVILSERSDLRIGNLRFDTTKEGKPFLSSPLLDFDFNITHDGDWVAIAFSGSMETRHVFTPFHIGVDVMEIHLPHYEKTVEDFVETMDMTLTSNERGWILQNTAEDTIHTSKTSIDEASYDQLKKLYILWTYKEAYTKAKGIGLGYDFQNIEINKGKGHVSVFVEEKQVHNLEIIEIVLPAGQSDDRKVGAGTGMDSLLVAVRLDKQADSCRHLSTSVEQAVEKGLLRLFSMNELVTALVDGISKKHNSNGIK